MATNNKTDALESARTRLESALSRLAQGVASTRDTVSAAREIAEEKMALVARVTTLEKENLKLHEQVAAHALIEPAGDSTELEALRAEKATLEQNYQLLKRQYAHLQDELEAAEDAKSAAWGNGDGDGGSNGAELEAENAKLKARVAELEEERMSVRSELDGAIGRLETMVGSA
jgi:multidrug resistance efflux pump